jgi:hypothetical protein
MRNGGCATRSHVGVLTPLEQVTPLSPYSKRDLTLSNCNLARLCKVLLTTSDSAHREPLCGPACKRA